MRFGTSKNTKHVLFSFLILLIRGAGAQSSKCSILEVSKVIDDKFSGIKMGQINYKTESPDKCEVDVCLAIDYDENDDKNFAEMRKNIHGDFCNNITDHNEGTCKSINATIESYVALKDKGCFPVFRNYFPAWKNTDYNSVACETGSFDVDSKSFAQGKENGCNGFGLCDTLRMILTLSANQRGDNDCGPTAALTLLSNSNPAKALKVATQLAWTGQTEILGKHQPCEYIYDQQPGVQDMPSQEGQLDYPSFVNAPGLEYMWAQAFITSDLRAHNDDGCVPEGLQLRHVNNSNAQEVNPFQEVTASAAYYWCKAITDNDSAECQIVMNLKHKKPATMTDSAYLYWGSGAYRNAISNKQITSVNPIPVYEWTGGAKNYYEGIRCSLDPSKQSNISSFFEFANDSTPQNQPQITELMLNDACAKTESADHGVIMRINGDIFKKNPPAPQKCVTGKEPYCSGLTDGLYPECDHFVVLLRCDIPNNNYTIWTWADEFFLSKETLIANTDTGFGGSICSMVIAGPKTNYTAPASEPYPCSDETSSGTSLSSMLPFFVLVASVSALCYAVL